MIIKNAYVFTEENVFEKKDVFIEGDVFTEEASEGEVIDGSGCFAVPGLKDIHFHGCVGYDFCDGTQEAIQAIAAYEASVGVTSIVPATMTYGEEKLRGICEAAEKYRREQEKYPGQADLCGINMEGPFISMSKKGAQNPAYIQRPDVEMFRRLNEASGGCIRLVALAPEVEGAMEFIDSLHDETVISIAHTAADYETADEAMNRGVHHMTHLYNAVNPLAHRDPGPVGAAADHEDCEAELICDGIHIHPAVVRDTFRMFGEERVILISDSMMAAGLQDGEYELGGQAVTVRGRKAILADGTIAGSATNLMDCVRTAVQQMGIPLETAIRCAAVNPARSVGIYGRYGSVTPGKKANLVLLDQKDLSLRQVILKGKKLPAATE